jgi:hypothetical protein
MFALKKLQTPKTNVEKLQDRISVENQNKRKEDYIEELTEQERNRFVFRTVMGNEFKKK